VNQHLLGRVQKTIQELDQIPTVPALLVPLIRQLSLPAESVNLHQVVSLIGHDESLSAQCLYMANSPLFGARNRIENIRTAVMTLGVDRVRDIAATCCLLRSLSPKVGHIQTNAFWAHSLACALVSRQVAMRCGYKDPEKAYVAGLLHDLGLILAILAVPEQLLAAIEVAGSEVVPLFKVERRLFGFDHTVIGAMLAERWNLGLDLIEVVRRHHDPDNATYEKPLVAIVSFTDLLCRVRNLGYGFDDIQKVDLACEPSWRILQAELPAAHKLDLARLTYELDGYIEEVARTICAVFAVQS
jgi:putative nucleotidyltransferase with HDIG domain